MTDNKAPTQAKEKVEETTEKVDETSAEEKDPRDALTPDHPRFKEVYNELKETRAKNEEYEEQLSELKEQLAEIRGTMTTLNKGSDENVFTAEELEAMKRIQEGLKKDGFVTRADLEEARRVERRALTMERLSEKYNNTSGYPPFKGAEILKYAKENGYGDNLEAAYKAKHFDAILQVEAERKAKGLETVDSEKATGTDKSMEDETTRKTIEDMSVDDWAKSRSDIMARFKKAVTGK